VAVVASSTYHTGMNTLHRFHHRADATLASAGHRGPGLHDPCIVTKKALERWENEGGRIPELAPATEGDRSAPARNG
jgi:hypothetical protein